MIEEVFQLKLNEMYWRVNTARVSITLFRKHLPMRLISLSGNLQWHTNSSGVLCFMPGARVELFYRDLKNKVQCMADIWKSIRVSRCSLKISPLVIPLLLVRALYWHTGYPSSSHPRPTHRSMQVMFSWRLTMNQTKTKPSIDQLSMNAASE